jgi:hypothetical protein
MKMAVLWDVARWAMITLMMEAVSTSETSVSIYRVHGATSQKTDIFIIVAVRT